jgi:hypothetical protein
VRAEEIKQREESQKGTEYLWAHHDRRKGKSHRLLYENTKLYKI